MTKSKPDTEALLREAARIVIRLKETPDDPKALAARDAFLARGEAEREAFAKTVQTVKIGMRKPPANKTLVIALLGLALAGLYWGYQPVRLAMLADWQTGRVVEEVQLFSGDRVQLDAASAVMDDTEGPVRRVGLLKGSGYFDVDTSEVPFAVDAGAVTAKALGTRFEVALIADDVIVAVSEGVVEVTAQNGTAWRLEAGDRLIWSDDLGAERDRIDIEDVAGWREDRLITNGMRFEQVIAMIDRRLPGQIVIMDRALAHSEMTGAIDLSQPETALNVVTQARQARVTSAARFLWLIRAQN